MNSADYNETLALLATMVRPIKVDLESQVELLRAENRNIRQRLTILEDRMHRRDQRDQNPQDRTTVSLRRIGSQDDD